jgi:hypothetical protein
MVLKKHEVRLADPCQIGDGAADATPTALAAASARIVAQDDAGANVEVTCSCGKKVQLRCLFAASAAQTAP